MVGDDAKRRNGLMVSGQSGDACGDCRVFGVGLPTALLGDISFVTVHEFEVIRELALGDLSLFGELDVFSSINCK